MRGKSFFFFGGGEVRFEYLLKGLATLRIFHSPLIFVYARVGCNLFTQNLFFLQRFNWTYNLIVYQISNFNYIGYSEYSNQNRIKINIITLTITNNITVEKYSYTVYN